MQRYENNAISEKKKNIEINIWTIDSLNLFIPIRYLTDIDYKFYEKIVSIYEETGHIIEGNIKRPPVKFEKIKGADIKAWVGKRPIPGSKGEYIEGIEIGISSKLSTDEYFKGINEETIKKIYNNIIEENLFKIEYELFLDQKVNDTDLCMNFYKEEKEYIKFMKQLRAVTHKEQKTTAWGWGENEITKESGNIGMQWAGRKDNDLKRPFSKFYSKWGELIRNEKNKAFYEEYIVKNYDIKRIKELRRLEINIKNYNQKIKITKGAKVEKYTTLRQLLDKTQEEIIKMVKFRMGEHINLEKMEAKIEEDDRFKMEEQLIHAMIETELNIIKCSPTRAPMQVLEKINSRLNKMLVGDRLKNNKHKIKTKVYRIWDEYYAILEDNLKAKEGEETIEFLTEINIINK
jgi:hypothetical protein